MKPKHRKHPTGWKMQRYLCVLAFGLGKPARADVQTRSNGSARPLPPTRDTTVGIKIITRALCPSDLLGSTCLGALPVFSKCLARSFGSPSRTWEKGGLPWVAARAHLPCGALPRSAGHCPKPAQLSREPARKTKFVPDFPEGGAQESPMWNGKRIVCAWGIREDRHCSWGATWIIIL